jgi:hypothetical protein
MAQAAAAAAQTFLEEKLEQHTDEQPLIQLPLSKNRF